MTRKRLSATNLDDGKGRDSQTWKTISFCPVCHTHGNKPHLKDCKAKLVSIPQSAQLPKRNTSKKIWNRFIRKFVFKEFLNEFYLKKNPDKRNDFITRILNKKK